MCAQRRHDVRYAIRFPAKLTVGRRSTTLTTSDVSYGGVFLRTDAPPGLNQLVAVTLVLPVGDRALSMHGMTVRVIRPHDPSGYDPGIGVQFYAVDPTTRDSWVAFVGHVQERYPQAADQAPLRMARGITPEPVRRSVERHTAVVRLEPSSAGELEDIAARALSTRTLFVPTRLELAAKTRVIACIVHPATGQPFLVEAAVHHCEETGLELAIDGADPRFKDDFSDFVRGGVLIDDEVVLPDHD